MDDVNVLNGMETLNSLIPSSANSTNQNGELVHCAFMYIPPSHTAANSAIIGRNYDFPPNIYGAIAENLTLTILNVENTVPTTIIGLPGQIYCPSCTNQNGLFMELNNGMPSGGYVSSLDRESMLINMLEVMQTSSTILEMHTQLKALQSDYSLIVSTANATYAGSFEYSSNSTLGMKPYLPIDGNSALVYTNFYLNSSWGTEIPTPTDATTWEGITRRDNLLNLANQSNSFDIKSVQQLMETPIESGGAYWDLTIYQIIFQPLSNDICLRRTFDDPDNWVCVDLDDYYVTPTGSTPDILSQ